MALNVQAWKQLRFVRSIHSVKECYQDIGQEYQFMTTYAALSQQREAQISSAADFHVRTFHSLENVPELPESVQDCIGRWFEPFAWYDHGSQKVKCPHCEVIAWEQRAAHIARRLRYLADSVPNDEMLHELHALARDLEG